MDERRAFPLVEVERVGVPDGFDLQILDESGRVLFSVVEFSQNWQKAIDDREDREFMRFYVE